MTRISVISLRTGYGGDWAEARGSFSNTEEGLQQAIGRANDVERGSGELLGCWNTRRVRIKIDGTLVPIQKAEQILKERKIERLRSKWAQGMHDYRQYGEGKTSASIDAYGRAMRACMELEDLGVEV